MRAFLVVAAAATSLSLGACRNNDQVDNTTNVDETLTAENIVSNDVTAIDAVTGADANMAADVNYLPNVDNGSGAQARAGTNSTRPPSRDQASTRQPDEPAPASQNSTAAATANNAL